MVTDLNPLERPLGIELYFTSFYLQSRQYVKRDYIDVYSLYNNFSYSLLTRKNIFLTRQSSK